MEMRFGNQQMFFPVVAVLQFSKMLLCGCRHRAGYDDTLIMLGFCFNFSVNDIVSTHNLYNGAAYILAF